MFIVEQVKNLKSKLQQVVVKKFISHMLVKNTVPNCFNNLCVVRQNHEVMCSLKFGIIDHLTSQKPSKVVVAKDIVYMLASSQSRGCNVS